MEPKGSENIPPQTISFLIFLFTPTSYEKLPSNSKYQCDQNELGAFIYNSLFSNTPSLVLSMDFCLIVLELSILCWNVGIITPFLLSYRFCIQELLLVWCVE